MIRRTLRVWRQEPWVWSVIIICAGVFLAPVYWALRSF